MQPGSEALEQSKPKSPRERESAAAENGQGLNGQAVLQDMLLALQAVRMGDFSIRMPVGGEGIEGKIADAFNEIVTANQALARQLEAVGQGVGKEGRTRKRVKLGFAHGAWGEMETSINALIDDLLWPSTEVSRAITAVAQGDLLQTMRLDVDGRPLMGDFLQSATTVNAMIDRKSV